MSLEYSWTYAHRHAAGGKPAKSAARRSASRNRYQRRGRTSNKTLAVNASAARRVRTAGPLNMGSLEKWGRVLVAAALIGVSVMVLGKQSAWQQQAGGRLLAWWEALPFHRPAAKPEPAKRAAALAAKQPPKAVAPGARSGEANAISVVRTDERLNRTPVALLSDSALFFINAAGQVWPVEPQNSPEDLPVITGPMVREIPGAMGIGLQAEVDMPLVRQLLASGLAGDLSEIHLNPQGGATLYTREGVKILMSGRVRTARDLHRLESVMRDIRVRGQRMTLIDLRYDQHVVVRP